MGYLIEYDAGVANQKPVRTGKRNLRPLAAVLSVAALLIAFAVPNGRKWIRKLVLPGNEELTASALTFLLEDLRSGEDFSTAMETFCHQIISGE